MKYFIKELWEKVNTTSEPDEAKKCFEIWKANEEKYQEEFALISERLGGKGICFSDVCFHDFRLEKLELVHNVYFKMPALQLSLFITNEEKRFEIHFENVFKFEMRSVENNEFNRGLDDWGYEEILPVDEEFLSFEILFASGATIFVIFPDKTLEIKEC